MSKRRKLEVDQDIEEFTPSYYLEKLEDSPETITFQSPAQQRSSQRMKTTGDAKKFIITYHEDSVREVTYPASLNSSNDLYSARSLSSQIKPRVRRRSLVNYDLSQEQEKVLDKQIHKMSSIREDETNKTCKLIFQNNNILQGIIKSQKIKKMKQMFIKKIMRTSTAATPVEFNLFSRLQKSSLLSSEGIEVPQSINNFLNLLSVLQIITLLFIYSVCIAYKDLFAENLFLSTLQTGSLIFYLVQIVLNLISIKSEAGKKVTIIKQIINYYMSRTLFVDVLSFCILFLDITTSLSGISFLRLFIVFKLPACLHKIQKLQVYFIQNTYNEQYWELAKVFFVNFCMAHVISIVLASMAKLDSQSNWMVVKGISNAQWTEQYVWSYYWAANIMLTVGFGDMVATNSSEAICMIFIETFSCIVMAYNINCMGTIITNIRLENEKRSHKFKIFKKLTEENYVPEQLEFQINNYIEESSNLKKQFNHEQNIDFINQLPQTLKVRYLKESNCKVLKNLVFFRDLLDRTLYNFAEHLEVRMTHPQETIRNIDDDFNLMILKEGEIGYACKKKGCEFNDEIVDFIKVRSGENPFLTSLDFISKVRPLYQIKSLKFSVLYQLNYNRFIEIFRESDMDYELFCFLRDKIRNIPDEFQVLPCEYCNKRFNHFKFTCPKLHYSPYSQHIIDKQRHRERKGKNQRVPFLRVGKSLLAPVEFYKKLKDYRSNPQMEMIYQQRELYQTFYQQGYKKVVKRNSSINESNNSQPSSKRRKQTKPPAQMDSDELKQLVDSKAKDIIQMQFLRRQMKEQYQDQIWNLNLDTLADFNSYFSQNNPHLLKQHFAPEKRLHQRFQKIYNYEKVHQTEESPQVKTVDIKKLIGYLSSETDHSPL